jgi:hypothetical protein
MQKSVVGAASLALLAGKIIFLLSGGRQSLMLNKAVADFFRLYMKLNSEERRKVRAWANGLRGVMGIFGK